MTGVKKLFTLKPLIDHSDTEVKQHEFNKSIKQKNKFLAHFKMLLEKAERMETELINRLKKESKLRHSLEAYLRTHLKKRVQIPYWSIQHYNQKLILLQPQVNRRGDD